MALHGQFAVPRTNSQKLLLNQQVEAQFRKLGVGESKEREVSNLYHFPDIVSTINYVNLDQTQIPLEQYLPT